MIHSSKQHYIQISVAGQIVEKAQFVTDFRFVYIPPRRLSAFNGQSESALHCVSKKFPPLYSP